MNVTTILGANGLPPQRIEHASDRASGRRVVGLLPPQRPCRRPWVVVADGELRRLFISSAGHGRLLPPGSHQATPPMLDRALGNSTPVRTCSARVRVTGTGYGPTCPAGPDVPAAHSLCTPACRENSTSGRPRPRPRPVTLRPGQPDARGWRQRRRLVLGKPRTGHFKPARTLPDLHQQPVGNRSALHPPRPRHYTSAPASSTQTSMPELLMARPHGRSRNLCDGIIRVAIRQRAPTDPERIRNCPHPTLADSHRFRSSHRIRLQVSSGAHPRSHPQPRKAPLATPAIELRVAHR